MSDNPTTATRLAILETQLERLIAAQAERDAKIDELLALKYEGMGAIWFATLILGTSFVAGISTIISWVRG